MKLIFVDICPCVRNTHKHYMASLMTNFTDHKTRNLNNYIIKDCERANRFFVLNITFIFNSLLVNHVFVDATVHVTLITLITLITL